MNLKNINKVCIFGDIHADWTTLNQFVNKKRPQVILQCGDFGYWPIIKCVKNPDNNISYESLFNGKKIKFGDVDCKIFWCPGNHENWWDLQKKYGRHGLEPIEILDNVFYCPLGSVLRVNHINVLFVGGADSFDKNVRTIGVDWFPDEILSPKDAEIILESVQDRNIKIDVVISHTVPMGFDLTKSGRVEKNNDPTRHALSLILSVLKPSRWWAGHWHFYATGYDNDCKWTVLDYPGHLHQYYEEVIFE